MQKKILFYTDNPVFGGGNKYLIDLMKSVENEFSIDILTNKNGLFEGDKSQLSSGVGIYSISIYKWGSQNRNAKNFKPSKLLQKFQELFLPIFFILNICAFVFFLKKRKPGIVVSCNGGYPGAESTLAMVIASRIMKIPVLLSIVSMPAKRRKFLWLHDVLLDKLIARSADRIVVNSRAQQFALNQTRNFPTTKTHCVYNGIEDLVVSTHNTVAAERNNRLLTLGYVGRLDKLKGVEYILKALAECKTQHNVKLIVVGEGPEMPYLTELSASLGLTERVEFRGFVKESIASIHKEFDVFIFPSLWEGLPYSVLEAMRSGLPVISTNVGGIPEAITHLENGILVNPANAYELARAIDLISEPGMLDSFSEKARKKFEMDFTLNVMKKRFYHLIQQTITKEKLDIRE